MEENYVQFTMRMDKDLYEKLKESAKRNKRSIAKELEYLTEFHLNEGTPIRLPDDVASKFIEFLRHSEGFRKLEEQLKNADNK